MSLGCVMGKKQKSKKDQDSALIAKNKKAFYDFHIEQRFEAGLVLQGWEVKSLREGRVQLVDSYVVLKHGEAFLIGTNIPSLPSTSTHFKADPTRTRKLLLHHAELSKLFSSVERQGYTVVPLKLYWKKGLAKLEIGLAKGKKEHDKREVEKKRDWQLEQRRTLKENR